MIRFKLKELISDKSFKEGRRITLQEVSDATGIHKTTLSKMQQPTTHNVTTANLNILCNYFECRIEELVEHVADDLGD